MSLLVTGAITSPPICHQGAARVNLGSVLNKSFLPPTFGQTSNKIMVSPWQTSSTRCAEALYLSGCQHTSSSFKDPGSQAARRGTSADG